MATTQSYQDDTYGILNDVCAQLMVETGRADTHASDLLFELVRACRSGRVVVSGAQEHREFMCALEAAEEYFGGGVQ